MRSIRFAPFALILVGCQQQQTPAVDPMAVHMQSLVVDTHVDVPTRLTEEAVDLSQRLTTGHFDFPRAKEGGLDASFFSIYVASRFNAVGTHPDAKGGAWEEAQRVLTLVEDVAMRYRTLAQIARSPKDVERIVALGKHAICLGLENGAPVEDLDKLRALQQRGIRYITLTHSKDNHISDSSYDDRHTHKGLAPFGVEVVGEMNRLGIMVDISHVSDQAFWKVLEITKAPVIASHSSLRTYRGWERNMSDDMLRALAKNGGVLQINFGSYFLRDAVAEAFDARGKELEAILPKPTDDTSRDKQEQAAPEPIKAALAAVRARYKDKNATLDDVVAHIEHAIEVAGIDHVGLGSDFDGVGDVPTGLDDVSKYPALTAALLARGHSAEDVAKINGANLMRVWRAVETTSSRMAVSPK